MFTRYKNLHFAKFVLAIVLFASCSKRMNSDVPGTPTDTTNKLGINVSNTFNYETISTTSLNVGLLTNDNKPLAGVMVNILDKSLEDGGKIMFTAITDQNGKIGGSIKLPTYMKTVIVDPAYIGLMHNATVKVEGSQVLCTIGGSQGYRGNVIPNARIAASNNQGIVTGRSVTTKYIYMGKYDDYGRPDYLAADDDMISERTLSKVNASLPERIPVTELHPEYLKDNASTNLDIVEACEVWITFVHEGAGNLNSLAFFTYPTGKQPTSSTQIEALTVILPNASLSGSGGELKSGNKVNIGKFGAGTSIGFCVIANGWDANSREVKEGDHKFYSIDALNPESTESNKRHTVLLSDEEDHLILAGFEDLNRDKDSDNDFNDLVFYASSNPVNGISTTTIIPVDEMEDSDGDGVADCRDKFPKDPTRAYIVYYPGGNKYASIAFEDTWPNTGDYDMNDMVIDYRYASIQNAKNATVELYANYIPRASGASFRNGFGVQFPFDPSLVASVEGNHVSEKNLVVLKSNGCEADQSKAVIIPFTDIYAIMKHEEKYYINTQPGVQYFIPDTIKMKVTFTSPISPKQFGTAPFNQFVIANQTRGKEIHLPGELPTDKANTALFNTVQDNTIPSENRYYKTRKNLPFAIGIPQSFDYPFEGKLITDTYLHFVEWAQSGGLAYPDWYLNASGYRNSGFIYKY